MLKLNYKGEVMRTGLIAKKIGMTQLFTDKGEQEAVTVLQILENRVVDVRTVEKHGYDAVVVGCGSVKSNKLSKPQKGYFKSLGVEPLAALSEFRVAGQDVPEKDAIFGVGHFDVGQFIDVTSFSKGKGFAGGMKRHNFGGLRASHGVSISHRSHGSTGQCQDPGRVFKGKKMAGQLGAKKVTMHNIIISGVDIDQGLVYIKGSVPGAKGAQVLIRDAVKKRN